MSALNTPKLESIVRVRHWTIAAARLTCLVWFTRELYDAWQVLGQQAQVRAMNTSYTFSWPIVLVAFSSTIVPLLGIVLAKALIIRLMPLHSPHCPRCRYEVKRGGTSVCPECGLPLEA
jgi:hypothetical protein